MTARVWPLCKNTCSDLVSLRDWKCTFADSGLVWNQNLMKWFWEPRMFTCIHTGGQPLLFSVGKKKYCEKLFYLGVWDHHKSNCCLTRQWCKPWLFCKASRCVPNLTSQTATVETNCMMTSWVFMCDIILQYAMEPWWHHWVITCDIILQHAMEPWWHHNEPDLKYLIHDYIMEHSAAQWSSCRTKFFLIS